MAGYPGKCFTSKLSDFHPQQAGFKVTAVTAHYLKTGFSGSAPSLLVGVPLPSAAEKLYKVVKVCAVTRPASVNPRPAISTDMRLLVRVLIVDDFDTVT